MAQFKSRDARLITFLLVEDDEDHAVLIIRSLSTHRIVNTIEHVRDGEEALSYLNQRGKYHDKKLPDVILLDLKLPKIDGHEVLRVVKTSARLKNIPVVVLTTSAAEIDRTRAYAEHANSYLVKPVDFDSFQKMADDLNLYWGLWNRSPFEGGT